MSAPSNLSRLYNFTSFSTNNPNTQQPGAYLDAELNQIVGAVNAIEAWNGLIQRSDGALANQSVGPDQLQGAVLAGVNTPTVWASGTAYVRLNSVIYNNAWYYCAVSHTSSSSFTNDLAAGDWTFLFNVNTGLVDITNQISNYAAQGATASFQEWKLSGNGATTVFTITGATLTQSGSYLVHVGGVYQDPTQYTVTANTITFNSAPANGSNNVIVICIGYPRAGFSAGSLSGTVLTSGTVLLSALATQANNTIVGNVSGSSASPVALTGSQVISMLSPNSANGVCQLTATGGLPAIDGSHLLNLPNPAVSGTGLQGIVNFINNGDSEGGVTGWNLYNNGAVATPTTGTGGVVSGLTLTQTTTNPIAGASSFQLAKGAANYQGEGMSYDFTVDRYSMGRSLIIQATVEAAVGSFSSGDVVCYIYDKTNSQLITPTVTAMPALSVTGSPASVQFTSYFATVLTSNQYRLIFHIATTSASAWTLNLDTIYVGNGPLGVSNATSIGTLAATGTTQGAAAQVTNSITVVTSSTAGSAVGVLLNSSVSNGTIINATSNTISLFPQSGASINGLSANVAYLISPNGSINYSKTSSTQWYSADENNKVYSEYNNNSGQTLVANTTKVIFTTLVKDTHSAYNNSTGVWTAPRPGPYTFLFMTGSTTAVYQVYKNGSVVYTIDNSSASSAGVGGVVKLYLATGDTIDFRSTSAPTISTGATINYLMVEG